MQVPSYTDWMLGNSYDDEVCSVARALEVVGERWTLLIIRNALFAGTTRFSQFQRSLGIASNVLTARLEGLVTAGLMIRERDTEQAGLHEYLLTEKGRQLEPALIALTHWGDRWAAPKGAPVRYRHAACGGAVSHLVTCESCGSVEPGSVEAHPGPGMPRDRAQRMNTRHEAVHPASRSTRTSGAIDQRRP